MPVVQNLHRHGSVVGANRASTLRVASQNIRSGTNVVNFTCFVAACRAQKLHVVAVQELHVDFFRVPQLQRVASDHAYHMYCSTCVQDSKKAGVAVLVSRSVAEGVDVDNIMKDGSGRIVTVPLNWKGHRLLFINAYVPNDAQQAKRFLLDVVRPALVETGGRQPVLLGDFNFVCDVRMDRVRTGHTVAAREMSRTPSDVSCGPTFQRDVAPHMVDTFRSLHPARRAMSFQYVTGAARLDRVYVPDSFLACARQLSGCRHNWRIVLGSQGGCCRDNTQSCICHGGCASPAQISAQQGAHVVLGLWCAQVAVFSVVVWGGCFGSCGPCCFVVVVA